MKYGEIWWNMVKYGEKGEKTMVEYGKTSGGLYREMMLTSPEIPWLQWCTVYLHSGKLT